MPASGRSAAWLAGRAVRRESIIRSGKQECPLSAVRIECKLAHQHQGRWKVRTRANLGCVRESFGQVSSSGAMAVHPVPADAIQAHRRSKWMRSSPAETSLSTRSRETRFSSGRTCGTRRGSGSTVLPGRGARADAQVPVHQRQCDRFVARPSAATEADVVVAGSGGGERGRVPLFIPAVPARSDSVSAFRTSSRT